MKVIPGSQPSLRLSSSSAAAPAGATAELVLCITYYTLVKTTDTLKKLKLIHGPTELRPL